MADTTGTLDPTHPVESALLGAEALPDHAGPDVRRRAEAHLIGQAAEFDDRDLKILGRRILAVVDPAADEAHEAALIEKEEAKADKATTLTITRDGHDKARGKFTLPEAQAAMLEKALHAIAAPKHHRGVTAPGPTSTGPHLSGWARPSAEYVERYPTDRLPESGGVNATVVVTMTLQTLRGGLAAAALDTGDALSCELRPDNRTTKGWKPCPTSYRCWPASQRASSGSTVLVTYLDK